MSRDVIASFRGVRKSYDGAVAVVRDLHLDVLRGEFLTLLGPSGSGKTTTLMMLAGFEEPSEGVIAVNGRDMRSIPPYRRNIGVVFQSYALFPHMTVAENLAYPLKRRRKAKAEIAVAVADALDKVRMAPFGTRYPAQLSGGQQQRVALARALIFGPDIVLMDEPLGALDRKLREEMQGEIRAIHARSGTTVVYVTHDQDEALAMSDRIAVFNEGIVRQLASPKAIYDNPADLFVAGFVGENNRIDGVVEAAEGASAQIAIAGRPVVVRAAAGLAGASPATVCVRPEDIRLGEAPGDRGGIFTGTVEDIVFLGDHARIVLGVAGIGRLVAKVTVGSPGAATAVGDTVPISFDAGRAIAFPAEAKAA